jgi:serine/threonine protein kinase
MNYRITEKIGEGGMGAVYLANHELLHTKAAIKVLHAALGMDAQLRARFLKEASTLSALNHPNIVRVLDFTENENGLFIIMEYVSGLPLDELIKTRTGPIPEKRAYQIFEKILDGFNYAHNRRPAIIHRDIKPSNIIITEDDEPKIIDFGIVKILDSSINANHTMTGTKIGTPVFMSPEQILGKDLDNRSDIYSLGITLFTMITGRSPFENTLSEFEIQENIIRKPLPRAKDIYPGVSDKTQSIIDRATAKQKENRYDSCNEFKLALLGNYNPVNTPTPSHTPAPLLSQPRRKNYTAIIVIVALVMTSFVIYFIKASNQHINSPGGGDSSTTTQPASANSLRYSSRLGDKSFNILHYGKEMAIAHIISLHENERTGPEAYKSLNDVPGFDLFEISQSGNRLLEYGINNQSYRFDPNKIFSITGIQNTLKTSNSTYPENILSEISILADTIINILRMNNSSNYIIALHNNTNDRKYNTVNSYYTSNDAIEVYSNPNEDPDDFYMVTVKNDFEFLKSENFNIVLQNENVKDDGSLSSYCARNGIPYINIGTKNGHRKKQMSMIEAAYSLITKK